MANYHRLRSAERGAGDGPRLRPGTAVPLVCHATAVAGPPPSIMHEPYSRGNDSAMVIAPLYCPEGVWTTIRARYTPNIGSVKAPL